MNQDLALRVLSQIMAWSDEHARKEFRWLRLMARLKYDGYRDFQAGMRFIESLATWLQQFDPGERETAYGFVRRSLVYVGPGEIVAVDNGDATSFESFQSKERNAFNGMCLVVVRTKAGQQGQIKLKAQAGGLMSASLSITSAATR